MNLFKGCLLASDVDGTLVRDGKVCERNIEKIRFFMQQGGAFSQASGRTPGGVYEIKKQIWEISPCVMTNGTVIYDFTNNEAVAQEYVSRDDLWVTERIMEEFPNVGVQAHHEKKVLVIRHNSEVQAHIDYEHLDAVEMDLYTAATYTWNKLIYFANDLDEYARLVEFTKDLKCDSHFVNGIGYAFGKDRHYREQMPNGITKASGIKKLCKMLDIKEGGYFAIGDFYNDLEMIKAADIGAVVEEAPDDIKAMADVVVGKAADGAVADFIDYLTQRKEAENGRNN